jgi:2,4-dichlorophenol 6-monooxygenase
MNQRYRSDATVTDGQIEPAFELDPELHYQPTTWPGARIPHVWLFDSAGAKHSTLDLSGKGRFTVFTGIGGEAWVDAAKAASEDLGIEIVSHVIGPRRALLDHTGDWARAREVSDAGCVLVRPDHHVGWRSEALTDDPKADLRRALTRLLAR